MKRMLLPLIFSLAWLCGQSIYSQSPSTEAQHLRRKGFLGIHPAQISDSLAQVSGSNHGVYLAEVLPEGTMALIGAQNHDILRSINGQPISDWEAARALLPKMFAGDLIQVELWRAKGKKGQLLQLKGQIIGAPFEESTQQHEVSYGEAPFLNGFLRTITMVPKSPGPHPIIYFIPGYSCFSIDRMRATDPYPRLFDSLVHLGNIVYRVEKPGMGDGPSPCDCRDTGFELELQAFEAGYAHLLKQPWANEARIFLLGHSMGGIQAPLLATRGTFRPKGIAVYGTVFQSWYEYILMLLRFQMPKANPDYMSFEQDMQQYIPLFYAHYVEGKPLATIIANPRWKALLERDFQLDAQGNILFRKAEYWQELSKHYVAGAWAQTDAHVLSIFGEADFEVFDAFSMSEIATIVNAHHPHHGQFIPLPGADHAMIQVESMEKGLSLQGQPAYRDYFFNHFEYGLVTAINSWIQAVLKADF
jgi:uncharacterized protein